MINTTMALQVGLFGVLIALVVMALLVIRTNKRLRLLENKVYGKGKKKHA